jgi:hypothetical protein
VKKRKQTAALLTRPGGPAARSPNAWVRFWFGAVDPAGLHALRILAGLLFLAWLLSFAGQQQAMFGLGGWFDRQAYLEMGRLPGGPPQPLGWSVLYLTGDRSWMLTAIYLSALAVFVLFTLGLFVRVTGILCWVAVVSFTTSLVIETAADYWLAMLAFYLMIGYLFLGKSQRQQSPVWRCLPASLRCSPAESNGEERGRETSVAANVALRLLQVHVALLLFTSGLHKLQFGDWWSGTAFWYPLHPPLETSLEELRAHIGDQAPWLTFLGVAAYATLAWQLAFPFFAWKRAWRPLLLLGGVLGWIGFAMVYGIPFAGPILLVACASYLSGEEWQSLFTLFGKIPGLRRPVAGPFGSAAHPWLGKPKHDAVRGGLERGNR